MLKLLQLVSGGERSAAERLLTRSLRVARIKGWRTNVEIRDADGVIGIGDVVFDRVKLVLEVDGWAYHTTPERFQRDRERQNRLTAGGWTVLRFTWRDLTIRPDDVMAEVRLVLEALGARRVVS
jgi:very-short-patch-repair endonuclease